MRRMHLPPNRLNRRGRMRPDFSLCFPADYSRLDANTLECISDHKIASTDLPVYVINRCPSEWNHADTSVR